MNGVFAIGLFVAGIVVTLQGWMLKELVNLKTSFATMKAQVDRFASDIESEKRSRAEAHKRLSDQIQHLETRLGC